MLRGCLGVGMVQTLQPRAGGRFGAGEVENFAKNPKVTRKPAFGGNYRFRRRCGLHVPGRTRAAAVRHVLRGCLGVGMVQTLQPRTGGRFGAGEVEIEKIRNFAKNPKVARKPAFGRNYRFRRRCGWHVPGRTRATAVRHVLRGCVGVGMVQTLQPRTGGRFGAGEVEIEKIRNFAKNP